MFGGEIDLCLGLPGGNESEPLKTMNGKRGFFETVDLKLNLQSNSDDSTLYQDKKFKAISSSKVDPIMPPAKAQVVGWPPVKNYRKKMMSEKSSAKRLEEKNSNSNSVAANNLVKVCMDGAPFLRKVDLKMYKSYHQLSHALANMFCSFTTIDTDNGDEGMIDFMNERKLMDLLNSSEYVATYEDKDGDWMLVGDVPWEMFVESCHRLRIMRGSEAIGLAPRAPEICKSRS